MSATIRILFIGNSYTHCNDLPQMIERLAADAAKGPALEQKYSCTGGWTFEMHWDNKAARELLEKERWDYMVLQEQTRRPYEDTPKFREYATKFHEVARSRGTKTVLYLTWAPEGEPDKQALLNAAYGQLGRDLGAVVVPSGPAFERAKGQMGIDLYVDDRRHPSANGSYLSACCFYSWLRNESPVGCTVNVLAEGKPLPNASAEQARFLQETAWQAWCDWRDGKIWK